MTEKHFCKDCKHAKGIGYDFWCDEGHTEYEVFGAETNCPYYEYHDWSKGTPNRTEKRFNYHHDGFGAYYLCDKEKGTYEDGIMGEIWADKSDMIDLVKLLNTLHEENELLQKTLDDTVELLNKKLIDCPVYCNLMKENQQLKETIKRFKKNKNHKIYIQSQSIKPEFGGNIHLGDDIK